jgi:hypothetical protein
VKGKGYNLQYKRITQRSGEFSTGTSEEISTGIDTGLTFNVLAQGRVAEALPWAKEMLDIAEATGDADLLITGHHRACFCYYYAGEFTKAVEHLDKVRWPPKTGQAAKRESSLERPVGRR